MDGSPEAMVWWLMERGLTLTASVDGYCGHGEGVEGSLFLVFLLVLAVILSKGILFSSKVSFIQFPEAQVLITV